MSAHDPADDFMPETYNTPTDDAPASTVTAAATGPQLGEDGEPLAWDCACGPAHNSARVEECPTCHQRRPFDYTPPAPTMLTMEERFDAAAGKGLVIPTATGAAPGYHVPVRFQPQTGPAVDVDTILLQSLLDVANKAAVMGAVTSVVASLSSPTRMRLALQVDYDVTGQPMPHEVRDE